MITVAFSLSIARRKQRKTIAAFDRFANYYTGIPAYMYVRSVI